MQNRENDSFIHFSDYRLCYWQSDFFNSVPALATAVRFECHEREDSDCARLWRYFLLRFLLCCLFAKLLGHTTEMLEIVKKLKVDRYSPRFYVVAEGDQHSIDKVTALEAESENSSEYKIYLITRSRKVHQSFMSSVFTTLLSLFNCIPLLMHARPDLILCNGPATCVPVCLVAFLFKVFYINSRCKLAFIESYCRVKSLSLSGKILLYLTDIFVVQWPSLSKVSRKVLYFGRLF